MSYVDQFYLMQGTFPCGLMTFVWFRKEVCLIFWWKLSVAVKFWLSIVLVLRYAHTLLKETHERTGDSEW